MEIETVSIEWAIKLRAAGFYQPYHGWGGRIYTIQYPNKTREIISAPTAAQIAEWGAFEAEGMTADEAAEKWIQEKQLQNG